MGLPATAWWAMSQLPWLDGKRRGHSRQLCFPNRLCDCGRPCATLRLGHELLSCLCMAEHLSLPAPGFAEEVISSAHPPLSWVLLGNTATRCSCSSSGHMCLGDTLHSGWGYNSAPVLNVGKSGIRVGKTPHFRNQIRQSCTPTSFLFRVKHPLYSVDSEAAGWDYFLGTTGMNLVCQDSSSGCCKLLPPSLSQSDSQGLSSADTPAGPMGWE